MDTKLKKFNDRLLVRACAFILCIVMLLISGTTVFLGIKKINDIQDEAGYLNVGELSTSDNYFETSSFSHWTEEVLFSMSMLINYTNEQKTDKDKSQGDGLYSKTEYDSAKSHLDGLDGVGYTIKSGKTTITNGEIPTTGSGLTITIQNDNITTQPEIKEHFISNPMYGDNDHRGYDASAVYILALSQEKVDTLNAEFTSAKNILNQFSIVAAITFIIFLILFIYLCIITGRRGSDGKVKLYRSDKFFTEFQLLVIGILCATAILPIAMLTSTVGDLSIATWMEDTHNIAFLILGIGLEAIICSGILWFSLSIIRMFKAHIFLSRSLFFIGVKAVYNWIKTLFSTANPMGKFVIIIVAGCLLSMSIVLAPIVIVLLIFFGHIWVKKYMALKKGVEEVSSGNLEYKIPIEPNSKYEFDKLSTQINEISLASNIAIQNELKNQRLKTDLISNVSHDLKTPLTSIITYTDLLKKEGLDSPDAEKYLSVIDEKGQRLKNLTEDLFEAAKASSGSIPVRMEKVDLLSLIKQGIIEFDESIKEKGLNIIINADDDKYYVNADSQLLWRVVENLLNNIEKYALENSRVYIDLNRKQKSNTDRSMILFEMKNVSRAPLNIPEDELMERFKRGDESRTTEGSGLGLAIAKDLVKLQSGVFELKIDGDLFKSSIVLDAYE